MPVVEVAGRFGARWGEQVAGPVGGGALSLAVRIRLPTEWPLSLRLGALVRHSAAVPSAMTDVGGYTQLDFFSVWLMRSLSIAAFVRLDLTARLQPTFVTTPMILGTLGFRVLGFHLGVGGGPDWAPGARASANFEVQLGAELFEIIGLVAQCVDAGRAQPR